MWITGNLLCYLICLKFVYINTITNTHSKTKINRTMFKSKIWYKFSTNLFNSSLSEVCLVKETIFNCMNFRRKILIKHTHVHKKVKNIVYYIVILSKIYVRSLFTSVLLQKQKNNQHIFKIKDMIV